MSNLVEQINDAIKIRVAAVLTDYSEAVYVLSVEDNNERNSPKRYGVRPLSAASSPGTLKRITMAQSFQVILMEQFKNRDSDEAQRATTFVLYDKMDVVIKDLMHTKCGIPDVILLVSEPSIEEPEYPDEDIAVLRGNIIIQYRRST